MANFSSDYIIRIYRFDNRNSRRLVGTAEEVGIKGKKAFATLEELWSILNSSKAEIAKTMKPNKLNRPKEPNKPEH